MKRSISLNDDILDSLIDNISYIDNDLRIGNLLMIINKLDVQWEEMRGEEPVNNNTINDDNYNYNDKSNQYIVKGCTKYDTIESNKLLAGGEEAGAKEARAKRQ